MVVAVLDADIIAYTCSVREQGHAVQWDDNTTDDLGHLEFACSQANEMIDQWTEIAGADGYELAFSGPSFMNFRRDVYPLYKSNRTGEKPPDYLKVVEYLKDRHLHTVYDCLEGDDVMGLYVTGDNDYVAVSTDKDIRTLPGNLVHVKRDGSHVALSNSEEAANKFWMTQTITGDPSDGYRGAPGAGAKAAEKALEGVHGLAEMWEAVVGVYGTQYRKPKQQEKFYTQSPYREALLNARCARILRSGEFIFETEEVLLWRSP